MMATTRSLRCSAALLLLLGGTGAVVAETTSEHRPLLQEGKKSLYQRVLTTPGCELGGEAGQAEGGVRRATARRGVLGAGADPARDPGRGVVAITC